MENKLAYALGFALNDALRPEKVPLAADFKKLAHVTKIPENIIFAAFEKKAIGALGTALGLGAAGAVGIPLLSGLRSMIYGGPGMLASPHEGTYGGMGPRQQTEFNSMALRAKMRNLQNSRNMQVANEAFRPAPNPVGMGPVPGFGQ